MADGKNGDKKGDKKSGIVRGAVVLAAAGVICRMLGVVFRIPLSNIVGNYGIGLYQLVFPLYSLLLIISSAGVPVAISKMVARVRDDRAQCKKILFNSAVALAAVGLVISALFMLFCRPIAALQGKAEIWTLYLAIGPSVFFVCFISAFRGYFQGLANMLPTALSQIVEQAIKVAAGLALAIILVKQSVLSAVFGAVLAVSVSELIAALFLFVFYAIHSRKRGGVSRGRRGQKCEQCSLDSGERFEVSAKTPCSLPAAGGALGVSCRTSKGSERRFNWKIIRQLFTTAAPITLMSIVFPLVLMFDSFFVVNALTGAGVPNATELYGVSSGAVHTLINLPTVVGIAIATALVPAVARFHKQGKTAEVKQKSARAIWTVLAFAAFCAAVYAIAAPLILKILYSGAFRGKPDEFDIAVKLLRIESAAIVLICLSQVMTSVLQGVDKSKWPLLSLAAGGTVKILFEIIALPKIGISAVSIANVACFAVSAAINACFLPKILSKR